MPDGRSRLVECDLADAKVQPRREQTCVIKMRVNRYIPIGIMPATLRTAGSAPSAAGVSLHTGVSLVAGSRIN